MSWKNDPLRYRWLMLGVLGIIYFLACLHRISPTVIARDLVNEFGADATALGLMASAYFYLYAAVQPPVGLLSDTMGPRRVVTIFTLISCLGCLVFGLAPNMLVAGIGRALIGIGVGGIFVPGLKIFAGWYKEKEFAGVTGVFLALGNAGNLSASLPLTYLVLLLGWRWSFIGIGAVSVFFGLLAWMVLRDRPEEKGWRPVVEAISPSPTRSVVVPEGMTSLKRFGLIFKNYGFWIVTLSYFFTGGPGLSFQGLWSVPYLTDVYGFTRLQAGGLLMIMPVGFIIGSPLIGLLADRSGIGRKSILFYTLLVSLICWSVFFLSGGRPRQGLIIPLFFIMGLSGGGNLSLYMTIMKEFFPSWLTGTAMGLMNPAAFLAAALYQPFTGWLMDAVGKSGSSYPLEAYQQVFTVYFISMVLSVVLLLPLKNPVKKQNDG
ncbi:MAG: MFS transporter [Thermodesulfobacteriota bacterium]